MQLERAAREVHQGRRDLEEERTATQVGGGSRRQRCGEERRDRQQRSD